MKNDLEQYKFTNGTKVTDWLDTLAPDDRERAIECVRQTIADRQPLNLLQVKIRMTEPRPEVPPEIAEELDKEKAPEPRTPEPAPAPAEPDFYHTHQPQPQPVTPAPSTQQRQHSHGWVGISVICLLLLCIAAFALNPSYNEHKQAMSDEITHAATQIIHEKLSGDSGFGSFGAIMGSMFGNMVVGNLIQSFLDVNLRYHNYVLFSTCTVQIKDESKTVSLGIFGKVITFDEGDIRKAMQSDTEDPDESSGFDLFSL